jgi:hypothetical protein
LVTKAVAYIAHLAETRKLRSFSIAHKLSYVYLWQLKTPKTDSKGRPARDPETGKIVYRRTPSFRIINRLKDVIPTEYWYEEATAQGDEELSSRPGKAATAAGASRHLWLLPDDPFGGVVSAYDCDAELAEHSGKFSSSTLPKIILDFPF